MEKCQNPNLFELCHLLLLLVPLLLDRLDVVALGLQLLDRLQALHAHGDVTLDASNLKQ